METKEHWLFTENQKSQVGVFWCIILATYFGESEIGATPWIFFPLRGWSCTKLRQLASFDSNAYNNIFKSKINLKLVFIIYKNSYNNDNRKGQNW